MELLGGTCRRCEYWAGNHCPSAFWRVPSPSKRELCHVRRSATLPSESCWRYMPKDVK